MSRIKKILEYYFVNIVRDRQGEDNIYCQCPFHKGTGKSPLNFSINRNHGAWCCFSNEECGEGSIVHFVMKQEHCSREKARSILRGRFKRKTPSWDAIGSAHSFQGFGGRDEVIPECSWPPELSVIPANHPWIERRRYTVETMRKYDVSINRARLDYVYFPVYFEEALRGFSARHVGDPTHHKWLHDPGLPRRYVLYNYDTAKRRDYVIVTEGILDVFRLNTFGYSSAVGVFGAKATDEQIALIIQNWDKVILALDGDEAGRQGAAHLIKRLKKHVSFVINVDFPDEVDCDKLCSREEFLGYLQAGRKTTYQRRDKSWTDLWS